MPLVPSASSLSERTMTKVGRRVLPLVFLLYVVAFLDRANVAYAKLTRTVDLGFSEAVYGFGAGIFFLGYSLFEVPSNLILARTGARLWIARIMITWGLIAAGMMFVRGPASFYALRFLLGIAEAASSPALSSISANGFPPTRVPGPSRDS